jgi:hypothetical protein
VKFVAAVLIFASELASAKDVGNHQHGCSKVAGRTSNFAAWFNANTANGREFARTKQKFAGSGFA